MLDQWWSGPAAPAAGGPGGVPHASATVIHVISSARREAPHRAPHHATDIADPPHAVLERATSRAGVPYWSLSLGRTLRRAGHDDVVVVHLEGYAAAHLSLRYAHDARCVLVLHGRGTGSTQEHSAADVSVVINDEARDTLAARGVPTERLIAMVPSINRDQFRPRRCRVDADAPGPGLCRSPRGHEGGVQLARTSSEDSPTSTPAWSASEARWPPTLRGASRRRSLGSRWSCRRAASCRGAPPRRHRRR